MADAGAMRTVCKCMCVLVCARARVFRPPSASRLHHCTLNAAPRLCFAVLFCFFVHMHARSLHVPTLTAGFADTVEAKAADIRMSSAHHSLGGFVPFGLRTYEDVCRFGSTRAGCDVLVVSFIALMGPISTHRCHFFSSSHLEVVGDGAFSRRYPGCIVCLPVYIPASLGFYLTLISMMELEIVIKKRVLSFDGHKCGTIEIFFV